MFVFHLVAMNIHKFTCETIKPPLQHLLASCNRFPEQVVFKRAFISRRLNEIAFIWLEKKFNSWIMC